MSTGETRQAPFAATSHPVGGALLRPLAEGEAATLGSACAAFDPYRRLGLTAAGLARYLERVDAALHRFSIVTNGRLVGVIAVRSPWLRGPFIEMMALLPAAQGQGLGRDVIAWTAGQAALTAANLWATVSDFNQPARRFYARQGFAEVTALDRLVAPDTDEILLRRRLDGR